jgi:hypothetical protein
VLDAAARAHPEGPQAFAANKAMHEEFAEAFMAAAFDPALLAARRSSVRRRLGQPGPTAAALGSCAVARNSGRPCVVRRRVFYGGHHTCRGAQAAARCRLQSGHREQSGPRGASALPINPPLCCPIF